MLDWHRNFLKLPVVTFELLEAFLFCVHTQLMKLLQMTPKPMTLSIATLTVTFKLKITIFFIFAFLTIGVFVFHNTYSLKFDRLKNNMIKL